jgi:hypothetical protein
MFPHRDPNYGHGWTQSTSWQQCISLQSVKSHDQDVSRSTMLIHPQPKRLDAMAICGLLASLTVRFGPLERSIAHMQVS